MSQLDRLESRNLVERHSDPRDRRLRAPVITEQGQTLRATVADACAAVEDSVLSSFDHDQTQALPRILFAIIADSEDRGSFL